MVADGYAIRANDVCQAKFVEIQREHSDRDISRC